MDNEDTSPSDAAALVVALYNHGIEQSPQVEYPFTFCAFEEETEWFDALASVYSGLNEVQPVVGITLQTYAGGGGNDPAAWTRDLAAYLQNGRPTGLSGANGFILPIQSMDDTAPPTYSPARWHPTLRRGSRPAAPSGPPRRCFSLPRPSNGRTMPPLSPKSARCTRTLSGEKGEKESLEPRALQTPV